jgi:hypothetical protein
MNAGQVISIYYKADTYHSHGTQCRSHPEWMNTIKNSCRYPLLMYNVWRCFREKERYEFDSATSCHKFLQLSL